ncbi:hypothetical protein HZH68_008901 [Vespula germanica]|uniref:Uncharacterized protein n=1 Tax=Vespula germanica TaxID=30212 RepID=A0A834K384_VESGE|nr:hypothetical protein HZH68_008901 [Vespula germanica]
MGVAEEGEDEEERKLEKEKKRRDGVRNDTRKEPMKGTSETTKKRASDRGESIRLKGLSLKVISPDKEGEEIGTIVGSPIYLRRNRKKNSTCYGITIDSDNRTFLALLSNVHRYRSRAGFVDPPAKKAKEEKGEEENKQKLIRSSIKFNKHLPRVNAENDLSRINAFSHL